MNNIQGWDSKRLSDLIDGTFAGEWGDSAVGDKNDIPVLRSTNFTHSGIIDYSNIVIRNIPEKKRIHKVLKKGDILLEKSGGSPSQPVGRVVYFESDTSFLYSNFTQKLTPSLSTDSKYLFYKMYFEYQNGLVLRYQQQTTGIINFQLSEYLNLKVEVPPLQEQKKIAVILTSVDEVIEACKAQINKLRDLKTGMMQDLLTKGIGHTEFKDSPVGKIPKKWDVKRLSDCCDVMTNGYVGPTRDIYKESGVPYVLCQNVRANSFIEHTYKYVSVDFHKKNIRACLQEGDVLTVQTGAGNGDSCVVPKSYAGANCHALIISRTKKEILNPHFLSEYMNSDIGKNRVNIIATGGAHPHLNTTDLRVELIPIPPIDEQNKITELLSSIQIQYETITRKVAAIEKTKKALMQDLLTGKVRVKLS
jgi:type I restriction enzyme S subunit